MRNLRIPITGSEGLVGSAFRTALETRGRTSPDWTSGDRTAKKATCGTQPARARNLLGWAPRVELRQGLARLIHDFRLEPGAPEYQAAVP